MRIAVFNHRLLSLGGGERLSLNIAQALASANHDVDFLHCDATTPAEVQHRLNLSLDGIRLRRVALAHAEVSATSQEYDLFINSAHGQFVQPQAQRSALVCFFPIRVDWSRSGRWRWRVGHVLRRLRPLLPAWLAARADGLPSRGEIAALRMYQAVWAITRYTQRWVRHYWQRDSALLYPLVEPMLALPKENSIISVGRFRAGPNNKKHEALARAFGEMVDAGLQGWQLHIVGGLTDEPEHRRYFAELQAAAKPYSIHLHANLPHAHMAQLFGKARLYWHATGFGEDLAHFPDRAEHFGISIVEAMSAGCVPVVLNAGGQPEIVTHGQTGLLWRTSDELKAHTLQLVEQPNRLAALAMQAQQRSTTFCDAAAFNRNVLQLISGGVKSTNT
jgi:glycosyltransferase involved in cell wall biosynthesis